MSNSGCFCINSLTALLAWRVWKHITTVLSINQSDAGLLNKSSCLAQAFGISKFIIVRYAIWATLCCVTQVGLGCSTNPPQLSKAQFSLDFTPNLQVEPHFTVPLTFSK
jgi:hypothetical protein